MAIASGRFITALHGRFVFNLDQVCYYQTEDNGKIKVHLSNGDSKELEAEDARLFLAALSQEPMAPAA